METQQEMTSAESKEILDASLPKIDDYLHPLNNLELKEMTVKIEIVLYQMKNKLESSKPGLLIHKDNFELQNIDLKALFTNVTNYTMENLTKHYSTIVEASTFYHYYTTDEELKSIKAVKPIDIAYLKLLFESINDKGTLILVMDFHFIKQITKAMKEIFGEEYTHNFFIKLYIIEKLPLIGIITIQKMNIAKEPVKIGGIKLLSYEIYNDLVITKPISYTMDQLYKSITYIYEMYQYQGYLSSLHPGESFSIKIKENLHSDNIECTMVIIDSNDPLLVDKKTCASVIVGKNYSNDFIYMTIEGNMALCQQVQTSRIMLIRPAPFNNDTIEEIQQKMATYIQLFKFKDCLSDRIPVMTMTDEKKESYELYRTKDFIVRDIVENEQKDTIRQLLFTSNQNEIQSEIKLTLTSKAKIKQEKDNGHYIQLPTIEKYSSKNLVSCFDDNYIRMFYIKAILSGMFFVNIDDFPCNKINVLILGAGIGSINYFFDKVFKSNVNITAVELSKEVTMAGKEYFGLNHYDNEKDNIKWYFQDAKKFLEDMKLDNHFDMIIIDINNTNPLEGISPPPLFFEQDILNYIHKALKPLGMYVINVMARSIHNYNAAFQQLDKMFPLIFQIQNSEDLNKIHYCFKTKLEVDAYQNCYKNNFEKLSKKEVADLTCIEHEFGRIIKRVIDTENFKAGLKLGDHE